MIRKLAVVFLVIAAIGGGALWFLTAPQAYEAEIPADFEPDLANGETMFWVGGCASCHAPPNATGEDRKRLVGGVALETPFGTFYPPNISPDTSVGIGRWSLQDFVNAMVKGVSPDGRHYYPAFPYASYQRMTIEDLVDLKAYLDTLPAIASDEQPNELAFPYSIRRGIGLWKLLYLDGKPFEPDPAASDEVNRGAYLVQGPGHCGECHTPRDMMGGLIQARAFSGGPHPAGRGNIPNITPDATGIGNWSADDIAFALESGLTPEFDSFGGEMAEVVRNLERIAPEEREAMAAYLKSLPAVPSGGS